MIITTELGNSYRMNISDLATFQHFENAFGNKYLAVKMLAKICRKLGAEKSDYHISESKLMQWVLTGDCPYSKKEMDIRKLISDNIDDINEYLSYVDDEEIQETVKLLYKKSVRLHCLQTCTDKCISPGKRSRINILLRMIWYHFITT